MVKICPVYISPGLNLPEIEELKVAQEILLKKIARLKVAPPPPKLTFLLKIIIIFFKKHLKSVINALNE